MFSIGFHATPMFSLRFPLVPTQHLCFPCVIYRFPRNTCVFLPFSIGSHANLCLLFVFHRFPRNTCVFPTFSIGSHATRFFCLLFKSVHTTHVFSLSVQTSSTFVCYEKVSFLSDCSIGFLKYVLMIFKKQW